MFTITKPFSASENGHEVIEYQPGQVGQLPPVALAHGLNIGAVVEDDDPGLPDPSADAAEPVDMVDVTTIDQVEPEFIPAKPKPKAKK